MPKAKKSAFVLSKALRKLLPESERANADSVLLAKSLGRCALCDRPLGDNYDLITADHRIAGGKHTLSNLYLAHKSCNSSRGNLDFSQARPLVEFKVFTEEKGAVSFTDVVAAYVKDGNKQVQITEQGDALTIDFGSSKHQIRLFTDPATKTKYGFDEIPVSYILDDKEVQPRHLMYPHVRKLALDFYERPVHEPSNCRLVLKADGIGELRQFDGQHKTTAQILIGRTAVPVKVYVEPSIAMLQALVVKIQQEIKKQPLTRSDTLAKLSDVFQDLLDSYKVPPGSFRTEHGLVEAQPKDLRSETRKLYFSELSKLVFFDPDNELRDLVRPGSAFPPTSDKVVIDKMIRPLLYSGLLEVDMDAAGGPGRDNERKLIVLILNTITRKMLPQGWHLPSNKLQKSRTENFFYQGSIGWWMGVVLIPTLRYILYRIGDKKALLVDPITPEAEGKVIEAVETLCDWPIWSTEKADHIKAMRSNTVSNVVAVFSGLEARVLIEEIGK